MAIYSGFTHKKLWFSIVMLVYQRVISDKNLQDMGPSLRRKNVTWNPKIKTCQEEMSSKVTKLEKNYWMLEIRLSGNIEAGWRFRFSSGIYRNNPSQSSHLRLDPGSIPSSKRATRAFVKLPKSPVVTPKKMAPTRCCWSSNFVVVGHPNFLE